MASSDDRRPATDNKASIALLRRLRAGDDDDVHFVHRIDVCAAVPEILVADLEPVPGTGLADDGYSRIWYFFHAKKYKNSRGDTSGHRQRAVTGGGGTGWHSENSRQDVQGSGGGTFCSFSYGRRIGKSIDRMGWCMIEYDTVAAAKQQDETNADDSSSNYVLCKVYRSPRAKGKPASASSSNKNASSKRQTAKKRKAGGGDHPEAPPAKSIQQQEPQAQQETTACYQPQGVESEHGGEFNFSIEDINFYLDESMPRDEPEPEQGMQQPIAEPETAVQPQTSEPEEFTVEWFLRGQPQQPIVEPPPGHGGDEFIQIQMPFGPVVPVVAEATVDDMLGLGPETVYGQWSGGVTTATSMPSPWSSYAPTMLYTVCSSVLQGSDPLQLPYLTC